MVRWETVSGVGSKDKVKRGRVRKVGKDGRKRRRREGGTKRGRRGRERGM